MATLSLMGVVLASVPPTSADSPTFYFHGSPDDAIDRANIDPANTTPFDQNPPTELVPNMQTTTPVANQDFVGNPLSAYWRGPFAGVLDGMLELNWYWSAANPAALVNGVEVVVSAFADPNYSEGPVQPQRLIGRGVVTLRPGAEPTLNSNSVPVRGTVTGELLIQVAARSLIGGNELRVHYGAVSTPSQFRIVDAPLLPDPTVVFDAATALTFAPATIVSSHFLGAEPMTTMERRVPGSLPGRLDPDRIFVDWPLSSRSQIGQLSRSTDAGDSFRLLYDRTCAVRNRPMCTTGGGGDTDTEVNLINGNLFFTDQVVVANEALASSSDHGDTFPLERQFTASNVTTGTDRQWLASVDPGIVAVNGKRIEAFLAYHLPAAGQYIQGIDEDGRPIAQAVPQILEVDQSGPLRVDSTTGPGRGWIYQSYRNAGGFTVGTAYAPNYQSPEAWGINHVSSDQPAIFPWLHLDNRGNAYAVWVTGGVVFLSVSPIDDPRNDPTATPSGRPGTFWTKKVRVTTPEIRSAVFPAVTAGDSGRIAIAYMGSEDCAPGVSDTCAVGTHWNTYVAILDDALALVRGTPARVVTGQVNHRVTHRGSICTGGTGCTGDRSLLDMIDLGFDEDGRVGVVFMDNNNRLAAPAETDNAKFGPFVHFAKQITGPALIADRSDHSLNIPRNARADATGDATWPNVAGAANLPALDITSAAIFIDGGDLVAQVGVADTTVKRAQRDLAAYNEVLQTNAPAERLQHVLRFASGFDIFHLSLETLADGTRRFFGGRIDSNDGLINPASPTSVLGAAYHTDDVAVTGSVAQGMITYRVRAADLEQDLGLGDDLFSATAFALAGPSEQVEQTIASPMRTVDAAPPFDANLQERDDHLTAVDCADANVATSGGWHVLDDLRAGEGTLCRVVSRQSGRPPFMELHFVGSAVDVIVARGPRGGSFNLTLDGGEPTKVDLYRAPADPDRPDNSGRRDLDFGVVVHAEAEQGQHTLRIDMLDNASYPQRNMVYVDGFIITSGDSAAPPGGSHRDVSAVSTGTVATAAQSLFNVVADSTTSQIAAVLEAAPDTSLLILDPSGATLASAEARDGTVAVRIAASGPAAYSVVVRNNGTASTPYVLWTVHGRTR